MAPKPWFPEVLHGSLVTLRRHVPGNLRANVEYFRSSAGPAWRFDVPGTAHHFVLYGDCERELTGGDTVGSVP